MEVTSRKGRLLRSKSVILELLQQQQQSGLSIQAFCARQCIPSASFHNWKKKYATGAALLTEQPFASVHISDGHQQLFAEVKGIKLYQPVSAGYLKELAS